MIAAESQLACPVCSAAPDEPVCSRCGWVLEAGPWLGPATEADRRAFGERLASARRRFDLAAAALAAGYPDAGDPAIFDRLAALARGGCPDPAELVAARESVPRVAAISMSEAVRPALARLVGTSEDDQPRVLDVVDVRVNGIAAVRLRTDELGVPQPVGPVRLRSWPDLLPSLPDDDGERRLVMAGGAGVHGTAVISDAEIATGRQVLRQLAGATEGADEVLVVHRLGGWAIPDRLLDLPTRLIRADGPELGAVTGFAPLRHDYRLVLIEADGRGATRPVSKTLFPAGTTAESGPEVTVPVVAPATGRQPVVVAVVAGPDGIPPRQCRPVEVLRCELAAGQRHALAVPVGWPGPGAAGQSRERRPGPGNRGCLANPARRDSRYVPTRHGRHGRCVRHRARWLGNGGGPTA